MIILAIIGLVLSLTARILATPQVVIVDDQFGDESNGAMVSYVEPSSGKIWNQGATCGDCAADNINTTNGLVMNNTWHDATGGADQGTYGIDFTFIGESGMPSPDRVFVDDSLERLHGGRILYPCRQQSALQCHSQYDPIHSNR